MQEVFYLRTLANAKAISEKAKSVERVIVAGAGLVSLKGAYNLLKRGLEVIVLVSSKQILSQVLDARSAQMMQDLLEANGMQFLFDVNPVQILADPNGRVEGVLLDDDRVIAGGMVLVGKGVTPLKGTPVGLREGILVNEFMETSVGDVYAAGDVAEAFDIISQELTINAIWPNAAKQGRIAGLNMAGNNRTYVGSIAMNAVDFFDLPIISVGITRANTSDYKEDIFLDNKHKVYRKLVFKNNSLVGYILVGDISLAGRLMAKLLGENLI